MEKENTNYIEFIVIYNELDEFMRKELKLGVGVPHSDLIRRIAKKNKIFRLYEDELLSFARLRNAIIHNPDTRYAQPIAEPHDYVVEKYRYIIKSVLQPPKAIDTIAIKGRNIYTAGLDDYVLDVMTTMNRRSFTYVPILEEGRFIGVFSENTIFSYIVKKGDITLGNTIKIRELADLIPIDKHGSESFIFVSKDALVMDIEEMFAVKLQKDKRLAVVFITNNGKDDEKLMGLITAWDIAGYRDVRLPL